MKTYYSLSEGMKRGMKLPLSVYMIAQEMAEKFNVSAIEYHGDFPGWDILVTIPCESPGSDDLAKRLRENGFVGANKPGVLTLHILYYEVSYRSPSLP